MGSGHGIPAGPELLAGHLQFFRLFRKVRSKEIIRAYGADRLLFGDDFPMWDHKTEVETLLSLDLTDDEYEKIFSGNAKRLLRMTPNP